MKNTFARPETAQDVLDLWILKHNPLKTEISITYKTKSILLKKLESFISLYDMSKWLNSLIIIENLGLPIPINKPVLRYYQSLVYPHDELRTNKLLQSLYKYNQFGYDTYQSVINSKKPIEMVYIESNRTIICLQIVKLTGEIKTRNEILIEQLKNEHEKNSLTKDDYTELYKIINSSSSISLIQSNSWINELYQDIKKSHQQEINGFNSKIIELNTLLDNKDKEIESYKQENEMLISVYTHKILKCIVHLSKLNTPEKADYRCDRNALNYDYNYVCLYDNTHENICKQIQSSIHNFKISWRDIEYILNNIQEEENFNIESPPYMLLTRKEGGSLNGSIVIDKSKYNLIEKRDYIIKDYCPKSRKARYCFSISYLKKKLNNILSDELIHDINTIENIEEEEEKEVVVIETVYKKKNKRNRELYENNDNNDKIDKIDNNKKSKKKYKKRKLMKISNNIESSNQEYDNQNNNTNIIVESIALHEQREVEIENEKSVENDNIELVLEQDHEQEEQQEQQEQEDEDEQDDEEEEEEENENNGTDCMTYFLFFLILII